MERVRAEMRVRPIGDRGRQVAAQIVRRGVEDLPVLQCRIGIEVAEGGLLVDGEPVAPGRYRLVLPDGPEGTVLEVADLS